MVAALPLVTELTLIWLHVERQPEAKIANHAWYTFWYVLPTLPMFLASLACAVHGLLPFAFKTTGSRTIARLHDRMVVNRVRAAQPAVAPAGDEASVEHPSRLFGVPAGVGAPVAGAAADPDTLYVAFAARTSSGPTP